MNILSFFHINTGEYSEQKACFLFVLHQLVMANSCSKIFTVSAAARTGSKAVSEMPDTTLEILWSTFPVSPQVETEAAVR